MQFSAKAHSVRAQLFTATKKTFSFAKPQLHDDMNQAAIYARRIPSTP